MDDITFYTINSLPIKDREYSNEIRKILMITTLSADGISIKNLRLPKLPRWIIIDNKNIEKFEGQKSGIQTTITTLLTQQTNIEQELQRLIINISANNSKFNSLKSDLKQYDNDNQVLQHTKTIVQKRTGWDIFSFWLDKSIEIKCDYKISSWEILQGYDEVDCNDNLLVGKVYGYFYRDINCYIRIFTLNKIKNKNKIENININLKNIEENLKDQNNSYEFKMKNLKVTTLDLNKYKSEIERLDYNISICKQEYVDIETIKDYLQ